MRYHNPFVTHPLYSVIYFYLPTTAQAACKAVAALLQYFWLSAFCWMLCEGVMLYLMLILVFSTLKNKWWFFFLLGWCKMRGFSVIIMPTNLIPVQCLHWYLWSLVQQFEVITMWCEAMMGRQFHSKLKDVQCTNSTP